MLFYLQRNGFKQRRTLGPEALSYARVDFKQHFQAGMQAIKNGQNVVQVMSHYIETMEQHFQRTENRLDSSHVGAVLYGAAQIWVVAQNFTRNPTRLANARVELDAFLNRMIPRLTLVMPRLQARNVSSILWAFARFEVNPDTLAPGIVDDLGQQFLLDIHSASDYSYASLLGACVDLELEPCGGKLLPAVIRQLACTDVSKFQAYSLSVIMFSLAKLRLGQTQTIDALCGAYIQRLQSPIDAHLPSSIGTANFAWALRSMKHVPSAELGAAMLNRICSLILRQPSQVHTAHISKILLACAELRLEASPEEASLLLNHLLKDNDRFLNSQVIANATWSLAVLGLLQLDTFKQLLARFTTQPTAHDRSLHVRQLYQAFDSLQSTTAVDPVQKEEWTQLNAHMLDSFGERPQPSNLADRTDTDLLYSTLTGLGLKYETQTLVRGYMTYATVLPLDSSQSAPKIIIQMGQPDHFRNDRTR